MKQTDTARAEECIQVLSGCKHQIIQIKGSPDPDALASAFALQALSETLGNQTSILCEQQVSLPQNRVFVHELGLKLLHPEDRHLRTATAYSVVDHQDAGPGSLPHAIPCLIHIDHHTPLAGQPRAEFRLIDAQAGATSSLIARIMKHANVRPDTAVRTLVASALLAGILTDTDHGRLAGQNDREMMRYLAGLADDTLVKRISLPSLSAEILRALQMAENDVHVHKGWLMAGIGFLPASERDTIAIVADRLLERHTEAETVIVYSAIENNSKKTLVLDASLRSRKSSRNLDRIIKTITPHGGGRHHKGAFQIPLDYLHYCSNRKQLWEVLKDATINALTATRNELGYTGFWSRLRHFFTGKRNVL